MTRILFLPQVMVEMLLKTQGCLNQMFEKLENLIQSGREDYLCIYGETDLAYRVKA